MKKYVLGISGREYSAEVIEINDDMARISVDGNVYEVNIKDFGLDGGRPAVSLPGAAGRPGSAVPAPAARIPEKDFRPGADGIRAPMPGVVIGIKVKQGERIKAGELVLIVEAMKMENEIKAPYDGIVGKIHIGENDNVSEGDLLVELKRPAMTTL